MDKIDRRAKTLSWCFNTNRAYRREQGSWSVHLRQNLKARVEYSVAALVAVVEAVISAAAAVFMTLSLIFPYLAWRERAKLAGDLAQRAFIYSPLAFGVGFVGALSPAAASKCINRLINRRDIIPKREPVIPDQEYYNQVEKAHRLAFQLHNALQNFEENLCFLSHMNTEECAQAIQTLTSAAPAIAFTSEQNNQIAVWKKGGAALNETYLGEKLQRSAQQCSLKLERIKPSEPSITATLLEGLQLVASGRKNEVVGELTTIISEKSYPQDYLNLPTDAILLAEEAYRQMERADITKLRAHALDYIDRIRSQKQKEDKLGQTPVLKIDETLITDFIGDAVSQNLGGKKRSRSTLL